MSFTPFEVPCADDVGTRIPQVAYGVGRSVGTAVVRNRIRRRLRVLMRECLADDLMGPGRFLVSVGPGAIDLGFDQLRGHVRAALAALV